MKIQEWRKCRELEHIGQTKVILVICEKLHCNSELKAVERPGIAIDLLTVHLNRVPPKAEWKVVNCDCARQR